MSSGRVIGRFNHGQVALTSMEDHGSCRPLQIFASDSPLQIRNKTHNVFCRAPHAWLRINTCSHWPITYLRTRKFLFSTFSWKAQQNIIVNECTFNDLKLPLFLFLSQRPTQRGFHSWKFWPCDSTPMRRQVGTIRILALYCSVFIHDRRCWGTL